MRCPWGQSPIKKMRSNILSEVCQKRQNGGRNSQKALRVPFPLQWGRFLRKGDGSFEVVGRTHLPGSPFGTNTKLLRGVFGLISMPNDYLNTVFDDVVSLWGSRRNNALPRSPILSLRAWKESLRNMLLVDRPLKQKHIHLWIVRRASNAISRRNKIETCRKLLLKKVFCNTKINDNNLWRFRLDQISHVISHGIFLY